MRFTRFIVALFAFWLAFGSLASAWAQSADRPCESMDMTAPADDCCGGGMDQAGCLTACLAVSAAMIAPPMHLVAQVEATAVAAAPSFRHAGILAPPDVAPPKSSVS